MDIVEFGSLTLTTQWETFWEEGDLIDTFKGQDGDYLLYDMYDNFYVELYLKENNDYGMNLLTHSEKEAKYVLGHKKLDKMPWD